MGDPLSADADQVTATEPSSALAVTAAGGDGTAAGVMLDDAGEEELDPTRFVAMTRNL
jgi:hypothetical protein